ncbi:50S ribosomal protein L5 [Sorangium cellulosum]|uniref:Large ribosomal subunit protein uL5 n=1 Tax=Sorangium cellulosum TaxID=56 RepID=A0A2L0F8P1_SORCE|nr:50S ribosomal protein L5 [Sorangium cellulosum]
MADKKDKDKAAKDGKGKEKSDKPKPQQAKPQAPAKSKEPRGAKKGAEAEASEPTEARPRDPNYTPRLRTHYQKSVTAALSKRFGYKNPMMVPRLQKVVINMGLGAAVQNPKIIDSAVEDMRAISGQKPVVTRARKSIATFKLRENLPIGVMVTLRAERMWEFVDRLIAFSLPRVRDFKGVSPKGFDGKGNFTMGLREQIIFPEIDYDKIDVVKGLNISFVTTAKTDEEGRALLTELGIPFRH